MLRTIFRYIYAVEFFDKIAFPENRADHSETAGGNDALVRKFEDNVLIRIQRDPAISVHGKSTS